MTQAAEARPADPFRIRLMRADDFGFILANWVASYAGSAHAKAMGNAHKQYEKAMASVVRRLVSRAGVITQLACDLEHDELLFGYCTHEGPTLHYVFVKPGMRRFGICRRLTRDVAIEAVSHPWKDYPWRPERAW